MKGTYAPSSLKLSACHLVPENWWLENYSCLGLHFFKGYVNFKEASISLWNNLVNRKLFFVFQGCSLMASCFHHTCRKHLEKVYLGTLTGPNLMYRPQQRRTKDWSWLTTNLTPIAGGWTNPLKKYEKIVRMTSSNLNTVNRPENATKICLKPETSYLWWFFWKCCCCPE